MSCSTCKRTPSFSTRLVNVTNAVKKLAHAMVNGERVFSHAEMRNKRLTICKACHNYENGWCVNYTDGHGVTEEGCGCNINAKASIQSTSCEPRGNW